MLLYSVQVTVDDPVAKEWEAWMRDVHIPDVLRTGCFVRADWGRVDSDGPSPMWWIQYVSPSRADFERYQSEFAEALKADHTQRYSGRVQASRTIVFPYASVSSSSVKENKLD